jgi:hypothetical protein
MTRLGFVTKCLLVLELKPIGFIFMLVNERRDVNRLVALVNRDLQGF